MNLREVINENAVAVNVKAQNKEEVFECVCDLLLKDGSITSKEEFKQDLYIRESQGKTGIGDGIAIPHGKSDHVDHVGIAVGRTRDMIDWESYDGEPSRLFFLFAVPAHSDGAKDHLRLIAELAGKLGNDNTMRRLQTAASYDDLLEAFS